MKINIHADYRRGNAGDYENIGSLEFLHAPQDNWDAGILVESMNKIYAMVLIILILSGCSLPGGAGAGPMVWIDRPLDGESVPLAPLILLAHTADVDGITNIAVLVSYSLIGCVPTGGLVWRKPALNGRRPGRARN